jgi:hypothetical protein
LVLLAPGVVPWAGSRAGLYTARLPVVYGARSADASRMAAGIKNILVEQGASFRMRLTWAQPSVSVDIAGNPVPGPPYDLTGARARMQIRLRPGAPVLVDLTSEPGGGLTLGGALGTIGVYISPDQTQSLTTKKAVYDLFVIYAGEVDSHRILKGKVTIELAVTSDGDGAP